MRRPHPPESEPVTLAQIHCRTALARVWVRDGRATVRSVADEAGYASTGSALNMLRRLRKQGLVTWDEGKAGTLRPLVIPFDVRSRT